MNPYRNLEGKRVRVTWGYSPSSPKNVVTEGVMTLNGLRHMIVVDRECIGIALIAMVEELAAEGVTND